MSTTLEIIQGLAQAASRAYDGAHVADYNDDGRERSAGLKREEGNPIVDSRVIDLLVYTLGFKRPKFIKLVKSMQKAFFSPANQQFARSQRNF